MGDELRDLSVSPKESANSSLSSERFSSKLKPKLAACGLDCVFWSQNGQQFSITSHSFPQRVYYSIINPGLPVQVSLCLLPSPPAAFWTYLIFSRSVQLGSRSTSWDCSLPMLAVWVKPWSEIIHVATPCVRRACDLWPFPLSALPLHRKCRNWPCFSVRWSPQCGEHGFISNPFPPSPFSQRPTSVLLIQPSSLKYMPKTWGLKLWPTHESSFLENKLQTEVGFLLPLLLLFALWSRQAFSDNNTYIWLCWGFFFPWQLRSQVPSSYPGCGWLRKNFPEASRWTISLRNVWTEPPAPSKHRF